MPEPVSHIDNYLPEEQVVRRQNLQSNDGGDTYTAMSEVEAKIAAAEARTDTKFAEMMGELRVISGRLDHIEKTTGGLRLNTWLAMGTALAILIAVFGWGSQMFGVGMNADSIARQAAEGVRQDTAAQIESLSARYENLEDQVGQILLLLQADAESSPIPNQPAPSPSPSPDGGLSPTPFPMPQLDSPQQ